VAKIPKYPKSLLKRSGNPVFGAAGIGILVFRQLSGIAAFHKIVTRFYFEAIKVKNESSKSNEKGFVSGNKGKR
jgi:hypothetical protein